MAEIILQVENLIKKYGPFTAVNSVSFNVTKGKVIGLLGPNGAGKTTTIQILLGVTLSNGGSIKYFGKDFSKNRQYCLQRINFTSSFNTLQGKATVWENLLVFAYLYGLKNPKRKILELVDYFGTGYLLDQLFQNLSSGEKTRVNIIKSLLNDPELILMDEPTASLDPDIADKTLSLIEGLKSSRGISLLYTSHDMAEVTRICDEVIFLDHGKIVAFDTPLSLTKQVSNATIQITFDGQREVVEKFLKENSQSFSFLNQSTVVIKTEEMFIPQLLFRISKINVQITDIEVKKPTLEDVFLQIARGDENVT
ncbi:MAG: ABC transporter ATP-binding protein [Patescibacteria group bacterium]|nr:ABC transporter ATP-binding protein [Patescibacteria group bacterium]